MWIGFGVLALSSFATLGLIVVLVAARPRRETVLQTVQAAPARLRTDGGDTLNCVSDNLPVSVTDAGAEDGVLVGTLRGPDASLSFTLDRTADGYGASITVERGVLRSPGAVSGQFMEVSPGEWLLLQVEGVVNARRLLVTGVTRFGSREQEVCQ